MPGAFKIGDHVSWNSEAGRVSGIIRRKISAPIGFKGYTVHASAKPGVPALPRGKPDQAVNSRATPGLVD